MTGDQQSGNGEITARILVVDDEAGIRDMLNYELSSHSYQVVTAVNGEDALEKIRAQKFHLVISDVKMPRMNGMDMLDAIKKLDPDVEVIMSTGFGTIETAVNAMKKGAYDFIQKPFNLDEILLLIEKALEKNELKILLGVYETSKAVLASLKLDELLPVMAELSLRTLKADDASILLASPDGCLQFAASAGLSAQTDARKKSCLTLGERVAGEVARNGAPAMIQGPLAGDARFKDIPGLREIRSSIVYPLSLGGKVLGVLNVNRTAKEEPFNAADLRHATIFCSQISQAINNAALYRELEQKIAALHEMQAQLVQSEKMAAIGQLSAGIAHEINNPLSGIMGFAEMLLKSEGLGPQQREDVETILQQSARCGKIVKNLLQFSRLKKGAETAVELPAVLDAALQLAGFDLRRALVEVTRDLPPDLPAVSGDASQLQQVFLNLIVNAGHALEGKTGGKLIISAAAAGGAVTLRFQDNGCGIPAENLTRVFDPFFTSKPAGKGTGLGLSMSFGILQQHRGSIRVESEEGKGAAFIITLPVRGEAPDGTV
jgi:signal transduction histidine kinase/ActR/RegA family two-component response regulator